MNIQPVVLAGGSGSRLWPISRSMYPKQFLSFNFDRDMTMLQSTVLRLNDLTKIDPLVLCNEEHRFFVAEQLKQVSKLGTIILEPESKNTAPAIGLASMYVENDPLILVMPADHLIKDKISFINMIKQSAPIADSGKLVTFGVKPSKPHTGYGYIKLGEKNGVDFQIESFIEKPSKKIAQEIFDTNNYLWNSGIFLFKASTYLAELKKFSPQIHLACKNSIKNIRKDLDFTRINEKEFSLSPANSIDYAVMEKTSEGVVVPFEGEWSDIGSWSSLWDVSDKDKNNSVIQGDVLAKECSNCLIRTENKLVAAYGLNDIVIVNTKDSLLVINKNKSQELKYLIDDLKQSDRDEWKLHREVYRPWGKYDSIDSDETFQVKRITVNPKSKLSLQKHHHRSEHWVVVSGVAHVTRDKELITLNKNESVYIPLGSIHSIENKQNFKLELIEVQCGDYLGEDDIVRYEDLYGRTEK